MPLSLVPPLSGAGQLGPLSGAGQLGPLSLVQGNLAPLSLVQDNLATRTRLIQSNYTPKNLKLLGQMTFLSFAEEK